MDVLTLFGGLASGKIVKYILKQIPWDYTVAGLSVKNLIGGVVTYAAGEYYVPAGRIKDVVRLAGATVIIDEVAHATGINPATEVAKVAPSVQVVKVRPKESFIVG